jgi:hypothetical protein
VVSSVPPNAANEAFLSRSVSSETRDGGISDCSLSTGAGSAVKSNSGGLDGRLGGPEGKEFVESGTDILGELESDPTIDAEGGIGGTGIGSGSSLNAALTIDLRPDGFLPKSFSVNVRPKLFAEDGDGDLEV